MQELIFKKTIKINADPAKVWEALTNPALTRKYMYNTEVISDWEKGAQILWRDASSGKVHVKGIILDIMPEQYLRTTDLSIDSGLADIEPNYSRVTYELKAEGSQTKITITEDKFNGDKERYHDSVNFWNIVLKKLKTLMEK
jgi:uncharacterized protein YndB with AHSA1/START domain